MKRVVAYLLASVIAGSAQAGAWPRGDGNVFLSFGRTSSVTAPPEVLKGRDLSLFFEYGLTDDLTAGIDLSTGSNGQTATALAFARHPILQDFTDHPVAVTLALGIEDLEGGVSVPLLRAGLSWGRGLEKGWLTIDTFYTTAPNSQRTDWKSDVTLGRRFGDHVKGIVQFQTSVSTSGALYSKFAPSGVVTVVEGLDVEIGAIQPIAGDDEIQLKIGVWMSF
ncbi:hypothetical protein AADZ90_007065 [Aestuariibius sp. 2305UL40-4]|uniref:hypothetical protein n=1 Tax=Aestuariibius violaceus TaxID=3234132 RepID=UPI00345E272D